MNTLHATLDHFEENTAVLVFDDGQKLRVQKEMLPGFVQGDIVSLALATEEEAKQQREKLLKGILNDIIDDEEADEA